MLHDHTADHIAVFVDQLPNVNVMIVPFQLLAGAGGSSCRGRPAASTARTQFTTPSTAPSSQEYAGRERPEPRPRPSAVAGMQSPSSSGLTAGAVAIGNLQARQPARVAGRIKTIRVQPRAGVSSLECTIGDGTGQLMLVFQGRRRVAGIDPGAFVVVEGMVAARGRNLVMVNPLYWIIPASPAPEVPSNKGHGRSGGSSHS